MPQGWQSHHGVSWAPGSISVSISSRAAQYQAEKTQNRGLTTKPEMESYSPPLIAVFGCLLNSGMYCG